MCTCTCSCTCTTRLLTRVPGGATADLIRGEVGREELEELQEEGWREEGGDYMLPSDEAGDRGEAIRVQVA